MKQIKRLISWLLILCLIVSGLPVSARAATVASGTCGNNLTWILNDDGLLTISGTGNMKNYDEDAPWDSYLNSITSLVVEDGVTSIGNYAFWRCANLEEASIADSVESFGARAFSGCNSLKEIEIPEKQSTIFAATFSGCSSLTSITIPDSVTTIYDNAFAGAGLTSVVIPESVNKIWNSAFDGCNNLREVFIGKNVSQLGEKTFAYCKNLESVWFAGNAPHTGANNVFAHSSGNVYYPVRNETWTDDKREAICAYANWVAYDPCEKGHNYAEDGVCIVCGESCFLASGTCGDGVNWTLSDDGKMTIYGTGNISVGNGDNDKPWKDYRDRIVHLEIMEGIGRIASYWAFANCENLTQLTLHEGLEEIGPYAFQNTGLTSVTIPASVTRIYDNVFNYCPNLTAITVDPENTKYTNDSYGALFTKDMKTMMQMPGAYTGSYRIPDGVETLFWGAFAGCQLSEVIIPASVNYIDIQTFDDCSNLKTIWFEGDAPAESESFHFDSVATAYYPANNDTWTDEIMERMGGEVFGGEITWVAYTPSATIASGTCGENLNWKLTEDGTLTISGSGDMYEFSLGSSEPPWEAYEDQIVHVNIKPGVTSIGRYAFYWLEQLETVSIPEGITKIGDDAFAHCSKLAAIDIPESVTTIGEKAFVGCLKMTEVELPANVSSIGEGAFALCGRLTGIWVDEDNPNYTSDEYGVIYNKDKTTVVQMGSGYKGEYTIPDSVTTVGAYAFWGCDELTEIHLSPNVTSIQNTAFYSCSKLTEIKLPSGLKRIENSAFTDCDSVCEIVVPASVEYIGWINPFDEMDKLSRIIVEVGNEFYWSDESGVLFDKENAVLMAIPCQLDGVYTVPDGVKKIGYKAHIMGNISGLIIPASVEIMDSLSFSYCGNLTEITFLGDAPKMDTYVFSGTTATCYYPADNATWTESVRQNYGGTLTWVEQTPEVDYIPGDVNGDNVVDLLDVITLVQYVSDGCMTKPDGFNITLNESAANVNDDGVMDLLDVILICQYVSDGCVTNPDGFNVELLPSKPRN